MRKATKVVAIVAAVAVVGGATVLGFVMGGSAENPHKTAIPADPQQVDSKCGLSGTPGNPTALPAQWENVRGYSLPVSATDGPGQRTPAGSWSCFAHTPSGAVLAGYTISMMASGLAEDWQTVVRDQTVPDAAQTVKLQSTPEVGEQVQVLGFTVAGYTDERATIAYYMQSPTVTASCTADVAWLKGDWRLKLQPDGGTLSSCSQGVPESFVPWGP